MCHLLPSPSPSSTGADEGSKASSHAQQQYELAPFTTLAEHDDLVSALAAGISDGESGGKGNAALLATGSWDCSVRVWDLASPAASQRQFLGGWVGWVTGCGRVCCCWHVFLCLLVVGRIACIGKKIHGFLNTDTSPFTDIHHTPIIHSARRGRDGAGVAPHLHGPRRAARLCLAGACDDLVVVIVVVVEE